MIDGLHPYPAYKPSGVRWLGGVPEHWSVGAVKQNYEIQLGKMLQPNKQAFNDTEVPYLKAVNVQWFKVRTSDPLTMWASLVDAEQYGIESGDLLVCEGGEGGRCGIVRSSVNGYIIQNALHRVRSREHSLNEYLQFVLYVAAAYGYLEALNDKATIAHFTKEKLAAFRIPLPPLPEQRAIVRYLGHVDRRIRRYISAKRKLIALLEEERKFATLEAMQSHSAISRRVEVVAELVQRPIKRASDDTYTPIGLYNRGRGMFRKEPRCGNDLGDSNFFWIEKGDLVISGQFAWEGAIAMASDVEHGCVASHRYPILRGKPGILDSGFLLGFFQTDWGQLLLDHNSRGAAGRNRPLNARALMKERISLPPIEAQLRIAGMLQVESQVRQQARRSEQLLHEYRTRLTADVVTGKLDVREAAAQLPDETDDQDPIEESGPLADGMDEALYDIDESAEELAIESEVSA